MMFYLSADADTLGKKVEADTVDDAVARALHARTFGPGTPLTIRWDVRMAPGGQDWLSARVTSRITEGVAKDAKPAPKPEVKPAPKAKAKPAPKAKAKPEPKAKAKPAPKAKK